jgi:hypothetical protein
LRESRAARGTYVTSCGQSRQSKREPLRFGP